MSLYNKLRNCNNTEYNVLVTKMAKDLEPKVDLFEYSVYKSGCAKERIPLNSDWVYYRAAAILLQAIEHTRTVKYYRKHFRSMKNMGVKRPKSFLASGFIIRHMLQKLEQHGFLATVVLKGRYATQKTKTLALKNYNEIK